ncbi:MAG: hypothetical protein EBS51_08520 [Planctomycetia bacterium]|nr:hypothetical protein [Planctomycetia bacterium]
MAARTRGFRTAAGLPTLLALSTIASALGPQGDANAQQAQQAWTGRTMRSVVVRQGEPAIVSENGVIIPDSAPVESVTPRVIDGGSFDGQGDGGVVVEESGTNGLMSAGPVYGDDGILVHDDAHACGPDCMPGCPHCMTGHHGRPWFNAMCEPVGLAQRLAGRLHNHCKDTCWTGRADALILWRNAPQTRPLYTTNPEVAGFSAIALDASQLESPAAGGGRLQLFRQDQCGNILEFGYLYGGQFFSQIERPFVPGAYLTAPPGLDGVDFPAPIRALDRVGGQLVGSIMSGEINRRVGLCESTQFLYGFRWFQWYEKSLIVDTFGATEDPPTFGADIYSTSTVNNLWGGQIGFDSLLLRTRHGFRVEGVVKAGAYANNAGQTSRYVQFNEGIAPFVSQVTVNDWPASCSFVGEVGMTGVMPICENWDFRFGYLGLWLTGLAQPTNQLSGQSIAQGDVPPAGTLSTVGTAIVQGVTLGVEGRW